MAAREGKLYTTPTHSVLVVVVHFGLYDRVQFSCQKIYTEIDAGKSRVTPADALAGRRSRLNFHPRDFSFYMDFPFFLWPF